MAVIERTPVRSVPAPGTGQGSQPTPPRRRRFAPWSLGFVVGGTAALWLVEGGLGQLGQRAGGWLVVGQWTGILAAIAALVGLILVARPAWLERTEGLDRLWAWHRLAGITTIVALLMHLVASTVGFAAGQLDAAPGELWSLMRGSSWMLAAVVSAVLFLIIATTSWRRIRNRMTYETWLGVHVLGYLAVLLGFGHQLTVGSDFSASNPLARGWWIAVFVVAFAVVLWSRLSGLVRTGWRGRGRVTAVAPAAAGSVALQIRAPRLSRVRAGQFFMVRVLTKDLWWQAHPISLSARPRDGILRFTIRPTGDGFAAMAVAKSGTRVLLEGPYGRFTADRAAGAPVLLIGGGVGIGVVRSVLADVTPAQRPIVVARAASEDEVPHLAELRHMVAERNGRLLLVTGPRRRWAGGRPFAPELLRRAVPDLVHRHVFVCGPPPLERELERSLRQSGLPSTHLHLESFGV